MMNVKTMKVRIILLFCWMLNVAISVDAQIEFHVAPSVYVDGKGTLESPFNSIEATKQKVAKVNKNKTEDIIGYLYGGIYSLSSPVSFKENDLGFNGYSVISSTLPEFRNNL